MDEDPEFLLPNPTAHNILRTISDAQAVAICLNLAEIDI